GLVDAAGREHEQDRGLRSPPVRRQRHGEAVLEREPLRFREAERARLARLGARRGLGGERGGREEERPGGNRGGAAHRVPPVLPAAPGRSSSTVRFVGRRYCSAACRICSAVTRRKASSIPLMAAGSSSKSAYEASRSARPKPKSPSI